MSSYHSRSDVHRPQRRQRREDSGRGPSNNMNNSCSVKENGRRCSVPTGRGATGKTKVLASMRAITSDPSKKRTFAHERDGTFHENMHSSIAERDGVAGLSSNYYNVDPKKPRAAASPVGNDNIVARSSGRVGGEWSKDAFASGNSDEWSCYRDTKKANLCGTDEMPGGAPPRGSDEDDGVAADACDKKDDDDISRGGSRSRLLFPETLVSQDKCRREDSNSESIEESGLSQTASASDDLSPPNGSDLLLNVDSANDVDTGSYARKCVQDGRSLAAKGRSRPKMIFDVETALTELLRSHQQPSTSEDTCRGSHDEEQRTSLLTEEELLQDWTPVPSDVKQSTPGTPEMNMEKEGEQGSEPERTEGIDVPYIMTDENNRAISGGAAMVPRRRVTVRFRPGCVGDAAALAAMYRRSLKVTRDTSCEGKRLVPDPKDGEFEKDDGGNRSSSGHQEPIENGSSEGRVDSESSVTVFEAAEDCTEKRESSGNDSDGIAKKQGSSLDVSSSSSFTTEEDDALLERIIRGFGDEQTPPAFHALIADLYTTMITAKIQPLTSSQTNAKSPHDLHHGSNSECDDEDDVAIQRGTGTKLLEQKVETVHRGAAASLFFVEWDASRERRSLRLEFLYVDKMWSFGGLLARRILLRLAAIALGTGCANLRLPEQFPPEIGAANK